MLSSISPTLCVDVVCLIIVGTCLVWDVIRGLSATLAQVAALFLSFKLAFFVCPWVRKSLAATNASNAPFASVLPTIVALALLVILFFLIRFLINRFIRILIPSPTDNIIGGFSGAIKGLLLVYLFFIIIQLFLGSSYSSSFFAKSRTGSSVIPALEKVIPVKSH